MIAVLAFVAMDHDISLPELCINKLDVGQKPADLILSFKDAIDRLIDICPQVLHFLKRICFHDKVGNAKTRVRYASHME